MAKAAHTSTKLGTVLCRMYHENVPLNKLQIPRWLDSLPEAVRMKAHNMPLKVARVPTCMTVYLYRSEIKQPTCLLNPLQLFTEPGSDIHDQKTSSLLRLALRAPGKISYSCLLETFCMSRWLLPHTCLSCLCECSLCRSYASTGLVPLWACALTSGRRPDDACLQGEFLRIQT